MSFNISLKTKIHFGTNIVEKALNDEAQNIIGNVLIVTTGRTLVKKGYVDSLYNILKTNNRVNQVLVYDKVSGNPKISEVEEAISIGRESDVNIVIGFGGGSSIDAAKAVAVGIGAKNPIENYLFNGMIPGKETLPIIAIPTTAGTGSELSKGAIITSGEKKIKTGIRGENIIPKIAIVDAAYTLTVPDKISMETGFDVLAHAIEAYVSQKANMFSEMLSEKAIRIVAEYLPIIHANPNNINAREQLSYASMLMGLNLANVGTCLPHRMQYPIGGVTESSHAEGLVALYPSWIYHQYRVNENKINNILYYMDLPKPGNAKAAKSEFQQFMNNLGLDYNLRRLGISEKDVDMLCDKVTGNIQNDKLADKPDIIKIIYTESM
ncbi:iron-containing alcohol dehydrogenase [Roseburia sp. AM51-8]|uniref:iron-containing alcohol dehydrogenase n=1 Tax=Roseburia sp. AM51-8 TaxID=2292366 RepID=UPI000E4D0FE1|nr:iron-containing alcohol dehydrogenase [Roseburia sp. AM51-8]RHQ01237.1 iron-containing alcohol dehydrogenase [Roseburia sp. AM51-8]